MTIDTHQRTGLTHTEASKNTARLLISCPDRRGIVAAVSQFLYTHGANILDADQHSSDPESGTFFMRMAFQLDGLELSRGQFEKAFAEVVAEPFKMDWRMSYGEQKRIALLVSKYDHCLLDLLWRHRRGELNAKIVSVLSNHPDLESDVVTFGVPFIHVPVDPTHKDEAEAKLLESLQNRVDLIVLARYMQVLSEHFLDAVAVPVINIHHSFLPAFVGANPYKHALARGVKIIGATAHYATKELDAGPIIEQDVARVSHRDDLTALIQLGRDIERSVLARAVKWHIEDRVLVHGNKTIIFA